MSTKLSNLVELSTSKRIVNYLAENSLPTELQQLSVINHIDKLFNKNYSQDLKKKVISQEFKLFYLIKDRRLKKRKI